MPGHGVGDESAALFFSVYSGCRSSSCSHSILAPKWLRDVETLKSVAGGDIDASLHAVAILIART